MIILYDEENQLHQMNNKDILSKLNSNKPNKKLPDDFYNKNLDDRLH
jgi:hypothetical protein